MNDQISQDRVAKQLRRLRSDDEAVRLHATLQLTSADLDAALVRAGLSQALTDDSPEVRKLAAWALARLAQSERRAA